jgi:hypothetical protein
VKTHIINPKECQPSGQLQTIEVASDLIQAATEAEEEEHGVVGIIIIAVITTLADVRLLLNHPQQRPV